REIEQKLLLVEVGSIFHQLLATREQCDPGHLGNNPADASAIASDSEIDVAKNIFEFQIVGFEECAFEQRPGNFKAYEVMIVIGGVTVLRDLHHIEPELSLNVRLGIVGVSDVRPELPRQLGKFNRSDAIDGGMAAGVRGIVRKRAQGEGVLVQVGRVANECFDKIAAANVVDKIAEIFAAERIVAHVLKHATAIRKGVSFAEVFFGGVGKAPEQ